MPLYPPQDYRNIEWIHRIGLAVARPAAADVLIGTLYFSTDTLVLERSDGTIWSSYSVAGGAPGPAGPIGMQGPQGLIGDTGESEYPYIIPGPQGNIGSITTAQKTINRGITVDGGGSVLTVGTKGYLSIPVAATVIKWRLLADQAGDIIIDIYKDTFANFPPIFGDSICASALPELIAQDSSEDNVLTGWTTGISAGDVLAFNIDSINTITRITLELTLVIT